MAKFTLTKSSYYLDAVEGDNGLSLRVREIHFRDQKKYLYWEGLGNNNSELYVSDELEVYRVVIGGDKLQKLTEELWVRGIVVNRNGFCLAYTAKMANDEAFYRLYDHFDWSKYKVTLPNPDAEWNDFKIELPKYDKYEVNFSPENEVSDPNVDKSQVISLSCDDLFLSCKYDNGPIFLWKVNSPAGTIISVQLVGQINHFQKAKLEINGFALQGKKLTTLRDELLGRQVMVNRNGWCLFYTGDPSSDKRRGRGGYYNKILPRFPWSKYGIRTSNSAIWGSIYYYDVNQPQPITKIIFPLGANGIFDEGGIGETGIKEKEREPPNKEKDLSFYKNQLKEMEKKLKRGELEKKVLEKQLSLCKTENELKDFELQEKNKTAQP